MIKPIEINDTDLHAMLDEIIRNGDIPIGFLILPKGRYSLNYCVLSCVPEYIKTKIGRFWDIAVKHAKGDAVTRNLISDN